MRVRAIWRRLVSIWARGACKAVPAFGVLLYVVKSERSQAIQGNWRSRVTAKGQAAATAALCPFVTAGTGNPGGYSQGGPL
ncbi:hypothetical protein BU16DRAFT_68466 [Lophium mytilinum]|uniref:Uncharacterized protein n=1 Tax=Lophium mytilinum TaxID=390894 RepID=A0A6A6QQ06_9PEZI|nr:hypothetical protein BU16DRAFT_68466 [Lophium mytilinum]